MSDYIHYWSSVLYVPVSFMSQCPAGRGAVRSISVCIHHSSLSVCSHRDCDLRLSQRQTAAHTLTQPRTDLPLQRTLSRTQTHAHSSFSDSSASYTKLIHQMDFSVCVSTSELPVSWRWIVEERDIEGVPFIAPLCVNETKREMNDPCHTTV